MNKYQAIMDFINTCHLVGYDTYFNFIDETHTNNNTSLMTIGYGTLIKRYIDGGCLKKIQCEIRQVKPLSSYSNNSENIEQMQIVQEFLDWINEQGKKGNFPDFGESCIIHEMRTPDGVDYPSVLGIFEGSALYAIPFEITYTERK